ncbi:MAG: aminofutalosine synthase MqnE [Candidatus Magnetobacterium sp. LHC-1]|uniref:Aminodeoxyfutalosine synthase n=1 Tax=Candidatus Magnetobacterium casense TaxID=1455061 RepID=A0ABS6S194_9BACT|nr:aminofutalosine synthase MqnE [Candidatus Magnetobacterium casensis]MBF0608857.1 aminofutalosine synthase MqnE [Nitrospirota bacterium]MBV6342620.1 aminofutalosine synthase MqnE [Candidatus Magnetobacterium casensis]
MAIEGHILDKVGNGLRLDAADILSLFESDDLFAIGQAASEVTYKLHGDRVYYTRNHHINPTNICVNRCKFCAFSRSSGQAGAYALTIDEIIEKLQASQQPLVEVHIVGGLHPDWPFIYYLNLLSAIKKHFPHIHIKAFTGVEIDYLCRISGLGLRQTLQTLKAHGLDTMPGGGAEIFAPSVREALCPEKISAQRWLTVHEAAHEMGIKTNATMLYGHIESYQDRVEHLLALRQLQDQTGGFQAFIPLSFQPHNTSIEAPFPSAIDDLKTIAISRLALDNFPHIKAYWIMLGEKLTQTALLFGANDVDGTVMEEKIAHSAGTDSAPMLTVTQLKHMLTRAGKVPVQRNAFYEEID